MKIYSVKNEKIGFFNRPVYVESSNEAMSYIQNILMSDCDRALVGLKDDLSLYELGEIDFSSGSIRGYKKPEFVCSLSSIFETIPSEIIPRNEKFLMQRIEELSEKIKSLESAASCEVISNDE